MTDERVQGSRRRRPVAASAAPELPPKRDTVTLQWVAVGVVVAALIALAAYASRGSTGGHNRSGAVADQVIETDQLRW